MNTEEELAKIHARNKRVELDKSWETSATRRVFIMVVTYVLAGIWMVTIEDSDPWLKAFIPTGGYFLSTLALSIIRRHWENRRS